MIETTDGCCYIVVESTSKSGLESRVNEKIKQGYIPTSQLSVSTSSSTIEYDTFIGTKAQRVQTNTIYAQGMVKE